MNPFFYTPRFYGSSLISQELIECLQGHVKHNLIQIDFKVKHYFMPKAETTTKLAPPISYWIDKSGMTRTEIARKMDVSLSFISMVEHGKSGISIGKPEALIRALDISPMVFFAEAGRTEFAKPKILPQEAEKIA